MTFQRRTWTVERAGWVVLGVIVIAAVLGFFGGNGPVASAETASEDGSLSMRYERFGRLQAPTKLRVVARASNERASELRLWLTRDYLEGVSITSILPEPDRTEAAADRFVFEFSLAAPGETAEILFDIEPRRTRTVLGGLGVEGGPTLSFNQFIYP